MIEVTHGYFQVHVSISQDGLNYDVFHRMIEITWICYEILYCISQDD